MPSSRVSYKTISCRHLRNSVVQFTQLDQWPFISSWSLLSSTKVHAAQQAVTSEKTKRDKKRGTSLLLLLLLVKWPANVMRRESPFPYCTAQVTRSNSVTKITCCKFLVHLWVWHTSKCWIICPVSCHLLMFWYMQKPKVGPVTAAFKKTSVRTCKMLL